MAPRCCWQVRNPATGKVLATMPLMKGAETRAAIAAAHAVFPQWSRVLAKKRAAILRKCVCAPARACNPYRRAQLENAVLVNRGGTCCTQRRLFAPRLSQQPGQARPLLASSLRQPACASQRAPERAAFGLQACSKGRGRGGSVALSGACVHACMRACLHACGACMAACSQVARPHPGERG